jgi:predicted alpha/beta superfamily hydrolase
MNLFKALFFSILIGISTNNHAQVTFIATSIPANTPEGDNLYIAGDFTAWNPGSPEFMMQKNEEGNWYITLPERPQGTVIKFKFTRGSWTTVEKGSSGEEIPDRSFTFGNGETVNITILQWADGGTGGGSTAAANVQVMDNNFFMPQLNRSRRIWIYLPPGYETTTLQYPVLYMHDGQNLFDVETAFSGEWEVDETLNSLAADGVTVPIVVGIDNGGAYRIAEYTPWPNPQYGGGDGDAYARFIVETLKPYIDQNYRTLPSRENTGIMGSSLGGLISHYTAIKYQEVFSKAGIFSPSYWFSAEVWNFASENEKRENMRLYQLCGTNEGAGVTENMLRMSDSLLSKGFLPSEINNKIVQGGQHNEALWRTNFREAFLWLFVEGSASTGIKSPPTPLIFSPNPAKDSFRIDNLDTSSAGILIISDTAGREVLRKESDLNEAVNIRHLKSGTYIIRLFTKTGIHEGKLVRID